MIADADLVGDLAQRVGVERLTVGPGAHRLLGEAGHALGAAGDAEVVDAGLVEDAGDQVDGAAADLDQRRPPVGVLLDRAAGRAVRVVGLVAGQRGGDDVAGRQVAVDRRPLRLVVGEAADVGAEHGVDLVLDHPQLALADGVLHLGPQTGPHRVGRGLHDRLDVAHEREQLRAQQLEVAALLVLVLQGARQSEEHDGRRVRVDLDRPALAPRPRVEVEAQQRRHPSRPGLSVGELRAAGVGGVRGRLEAPEVGGERLLGGPGPGGVGDDQRCVEGDQAGPVGVRRQRGEDLLVGAHRRDVDQPPVLVEDREAGRTPLPPGEVDPDVVHRRSLSTTGSVARVPRRPGAVGGVVATWAVAGGAFRRFDRGGTGAGDTLRPHGGA